MWVWFPVCLFIRDSFAQELVSWEHEACPLFGIKKVRLWEVTSVVLDISNTTEVTSHIIKLERLPSSGRVRYGR